MKALCEGCSQPTSHTASVGHGVTQYLVALCEYCSMCEGCLEPMPNDALQLTGSGSLLCSVCWMA
jgi:hypothetical protein